MTEVTHLARIEAGRIRLDRQSCAVSALIETVLKQLEVPLAGRPVEVALPQPLPAVLVDRELLQLVLRHLMDNALKYGTPQSAIRLRAFERGGSVRISVWNDGEEIPEWERPRLFEKFYRGTTAGAQSTGTGMGLAIAREIIAAHGGDRKSVV